MSFIIKGGFDILQNKIVNIILQKNSIWNFGMVIYNKRQIFNINSSRENKIEIIKNNMKHALVLNDMIIYENDNLFMYDIHLHINVNDNVNVNDNDIYNNIIYDVINYNDLCELKLMRSLN
jgi:hypothetical protein